MLGQMERNRFSTARVSSGALVREFSVLDADPDHDCRHVELFAQDVRPRVRLEVIRPAAAPTCDPSWMGSDVGGLVECCEESLSALPVEGSELSPCLMGAVGEDLGGGTEVGSVATGELAEVEAIDAAGACGEDSEVVEVAVSVAAVDVVCGALGDEGTELVGYSDAHLAGDADDGVGVSSLECLAGSRRLEDRSLRPSGCDA